MSKIDYDGYKKNNEFNTWVSHLYCKRWGLREGMREILQNQKDEIINQIGKENLEIKTYNDSNYDFDFIHKDTQEIYGGIRYDRAKEILTIENKGHLETYNLLLGGTSRNEETANKDIIGCFGEGLKLAALAFLREEKLFMIYNGDKVWRFYLKEDQNFKRNGKAEKCLFWRSEDSNNANNQNKVVVQIQFITFEEWKEQIDNFLWLATKIKKLGLIHTDNYGDIILNPNFKNKIFSKGVFVTKTDSDICYGYNIDLVLDRDRNCIPNFDEFKEKGNKIIWYLLENYKEENKKQNQYLDSDEINMFNEFPEQIIHFLEEDLSFLKQNYYPYTYANKKAADFLWKLNGEIRKIKDKRFAQDNLYLYPQPLYYKSSLDSFLKKHYLPEDFYDFFITSSLFAYTLEQSTYYESYETKFDNLAKSADVNIPKELDKTIDEIANKIKLIKKSFNKKNLIFKKFSPPKVYFQKNETFYFSSLLFDNPQDMEKFVFGKCLDMMEIKILDLLDKFHITPK